MNKHLDTLTEQIEIYSTLDPNDGNGMVECLRLISSALFFLEKERAKYHETFQSSMNKLIVSGEPVSRAENKAHIIVPELYMLRRVMDSGYKVSDAIRTNISWIKSGLVNG